MNSALQTQLEELRTVGYTLIRGLSDQREGELIRSECKTLLSAGFGPDYLSSVREQMMPGQAPASPFVGGMLEDPRFADLAFAHLGDDALGAQAYVTRFKGNTEWHRGPMESEEGIKFLVYLDPLLANTGALRVLPRSHEWTLTEKQQAQLKKDADKVVAPALETVPGDVIVFDLRLWHATFGGGPFRQTAQFVFFQPPRTEEALRRFARDFHQRDSQYARYGLDVPALHPDWLANPGKNPIRQRWIDFAARVSRDYGPES